MIYREFFGRGLSMLKLRQKFRKNGRSRRRPSNPRLQLAAQVAHLEPRCLLSNTVTGGHHGAHAAAGRSSSSSDIINFAGYQWNTNYHFNKDSGYYNNGQQWAPQNAVVTNGQLHLHLRQATVDDKYTALSSAEVDLVGTSSGQPFNPGYGTYLVSATTKGSFNRLASNNGAIFGAFTYENLTGAGRISANTISGLPASLLATLKPGMAVSGQNYEGKALFHKGTTVLSVTGNNVVVSKDAILSGEHTIYFTDTSVVNQHRELDLTETSRFGIESDPNFSQFTLQPYQSNPKNVHRFKFKEDGQITLVMQWNGPQTPVTFSEYAGIYTLNNLPATPTYSWTTPAELDKYIPNSSNQTFHLNLWRANWKNPPDPQPEEVTVTNFQYVSLN
jgi:hypothetical protein